MGFFEDVVAKHKEDIVAKIFDDKLQEKVINNYWVFMANVILGFEPKKEKMSQSKREKIKTVFS